MKKIFTLFAALAMVMSMSAATWTVAGGPSTVFGTEWDTNTTANDMKKQADGTYKWEKTGVTLAKCNIEFKVVKDHAWNESYPGSNQKLAISESGTYDITITFNESTKVVNAKATKTAAAELIPTVVIAGDMNGWSTTKDAFTISDDKKTASLTLTLAAKTYGFKMVVAGSWLSDGKTIQRANPSHTFTGANGGNSNLKVEVDGECTFTWTYATNTLDVTFPASDDPIVPIEMEKVYFVNVDKWETVNIYTWESEVAGWPGSAMVKEAEQIAGYDLYSYEVEKGTTFGGMLFNNANGVQTGDLVWTAGKYYVKDGWYTKEEAEAKLAGPVTPPVITYVLMGVDGDWTTGIALTANPDNANEYVLLGQAISEGDAVKVVTLTDGTATAWCGNVDEYSVERSYDDMGNIVLAPGKYDFYYKVAEDVIYIAAVEPEYNVVEDEITNLMIDMESMCIIGGPSAEFGVDVFLALTEQNQDGTWALSDESSVAIQGVDATFIDGYAYDIDVNAPAVKVVLRVEFGGSNYELHIDMVSKPVVIEIADAIVSKEEYPDGMGGTYTNWTMDGQWSDGETTYPVLVNMPDFDPTIVEADMTVTITIGSWVEVMYGAAEGSVHATVAENVVTLTGTLTSYAAGTWEVTISGTLPGGATTALDNIDATVAPVKVINNGQLIIIRNGVQYNAQGAILK